MATPVSTYLGRITSYHRNRPNLAAVVAALVAPLTDVQVFLDSMPEAFDLDTAVGVQLDQVGQWVGRTRDVNVPLQGVYFSFDSALLGFDEAVWFSQFDPAEGVDTLDDDTYRRLLYAKIIANGWDGSVAQATAAYRELLGPALLTAGGNVQLEDDGGPLLLQSGGAVLLEDESVGTSLFVQDTGDMTMIVGLSGILPGAIYQALLAGDYVPVKPVGVKLIYLATTVNGTAMFGFDVNNNYLSGFDSGSWGSAVQPVGGATDLLGVSFILGSSVLS